jgi:hypothetical protein
MIALGLRGFNFKMSTHFSRFRRNLKMIPEVVFHSLV